GELRPDVATGPLAVSVAIVAGLFAGWADLLWVRQCPDTCTPLPVVYPETQIASLWLPVSTCSSLLAEGPVIQEKCRTHRFWDRQRNNTCRVPAARVLQAESRGRISLRDR